MPLIDIAAYAGNTVVGHMDRHLMNDDRYDVRHGDEDNFHGVMFLSMRDRASAMRAVREKDSLS
jgi:hypothetical protein